MKDGAERPAGAAAAASPFVRSADPRLAGALAAMAVHDLRNLLAVAESSAYLAAGNLDDKPFAEKHLAKISATLRKAQELASRCLDVAKGQPVVRSDVTVGELWGDVARDLSVPQGVTLQLADDSHALVVRCEPALLGRALANLVENSLAAIAPRGHGRVTLEAQASGSSIALRVRDDGPGIAAGVAFAGVTTKPHGSGLGMLVARAVVAAHGGTLELVDAATGTTFEILLPG